MNGEFPFKQKKPSYVNDEELKKGRKNVFLQVLIYCWLHSKDYKKIGSFRDQNADFAALIAKAKAPESLTHDRWREAFLQLVQQKLQIHQWPKICENQ